jgi:hypothetical protein
VRQCKELGRFRDDGTNLYDYDHRNQLVRIRRNPRTWTWRSVAFGINGVVRDDRDHICRAEVHRSWFLSRERQTALIHFMQQLDREIESGDRHYNLREFNCVNYVAAVAGAGGVQLPDAQGEATGFSGQAPGILGERLR